MTTPDIYQDDESGDLDVFVPPQYTAELLEFLRGKVPFFGVTIEAVDAFPDEEEDEEVETDEETPEGEDEQTEDADEGEDDAEGLDAFSFPSEVDEAVLTALLEEFFSAK